LKFAKLQSKGTSEGDKGKSIFVKGFSKSRWMHSDLHRAFESAGTILSAKVSLDRDHQCKGYGYVQFETQEHCQKAILNVKINT
jgi:RNA recognition motif-containing protein